MFGARNEWVSPRVVAATTETHPLRGPQSGPAFVLFEGEQAEELQDLDDAPSRLDRSQFLWVDTDELTAELAEQLASALRADERRAHEMLEDGVRGFNDGGDFVRVSMRTPTTETSDEVVRLICVVGDHWALTATTSRSPCSKTSPSSQWARARPGTWTARRFLPCCSSGC